MSFLSRTPSSFSRALRLFENPTMLIGAAFLILVILGIGFYSFTSLTSSESEMLVVQTEECEEQEPAKTVTVHVVGAVVNPGVYELEEGSRINDAIQSAGGFSQDAETSALNLARVLVDGEQLCVYTQEEYRALTQNQTNQSGSSDYQNSSSGASSGVSSSTSSALVNINSAPQSQLETLPGIGEATAKKIIAYREEVGPFTKTTDLMKVSGIGEKKFDALKDLICV